MASLHRNGFLCAVERFWRGVLAVSFAEAQMREEGLAGARCLSEAGLPEVEGKVQSERCHLGRRALHVKKWVSEVQEMWGTALGSIREEGYVFRVQAMRWERCKGPSSWWESEKHVLGSLGIGRCATENHSEGGVWNQPSFYTVCGTLLYISISSKKLSFQCHKLQFRQLILSSRSCFWNLCLQGPMPPALRCVTFHLTCVCYEHYQKLAVPFGLDSINLSAWGQILLSSTLDPFFPERQQRALVMSTEESQRIAGPPALGWFNQQNNGGFPTEI